jgi:hypothetical protein
VLPVAVVAFLAQSAPASAHLRSGVIAVDYRASVLRPVTAAYLAQIYQSDHGLSLTLRPAHTVVVLGYLREPVLRLNRAGLSINAASPTARDLGLVSKADAIDAAKPHWLLRPGRRSVTWHDARTQRLPPGVDQGRWGVPLIVDGHGTWLEGELRRFPAPAVWVWSAALACVLAVSGWALAVRGRRHERVAMIAFAVVAASALVVIEVAFGLDAYASPGKWIEGFDVIALIAVGLAVLLRGRENLQVGAASGIGLIAVSVGLLNGAVFLHPIALAILPSTVMRALVVAAIGAGTTAIVFGARVYADASTPPPASRFPPTHPHQAI